MFLSEAALPEILERVQVRLDLRGYGLHGDCAQPFLVRPKDYQADPLGWPELWVPPEPQFEASRIEAARCEEDRGQGTPGLSSHPPWALLTTHGKWPLPQ